MFIALGAALTRVSNWNLARYFTAMFWYGKHCLAFVYSLCVLCDPCMSVCVTERDYHIESYAMLHITWLDWCRWNIYWHLALREQYYAYIMYLLNQDGD